MARFAHALVIALCLAPAALLISGFLRDDLGANPVERITHVTGDWSLRFLVLTLAITPVRKLLNMPKLITYRRTLGLFAFFYAAVHFGIYLWLDKLFEWPEMVKDIAKRPFITAGFLGLVVMVPLALTSTSGWIRRLGGKRWQLLHRLTYAAAVAGAVHYYWLVKSDVRAPLVYSSIIAALLGYRLWMRFQTKAVQPAPVRRPAVSQPDRTGGA
jgi:sulfoxide reductase heme-binding subunit YedZ